MKYNQPIQKQTEIIDSPPLGDQYPVLNDAYFHTENNQQAKLVFSREISLEEMTTLARAIA